VRRRGLGSAGRLSRPQKESGGGKTVAVAKNQERERLYLVNVKTGGASRIPLEDLKNVQSEVWNDWDDGRQKGKIKKKPISENADLL